MKKYILLLLVFLQISAVAQMRKANKLFTEFRYSEAIPLFEKEVRHDNNKTRYDAVVKLAKCYQKTSKYQQAIKWYRQAVTHKNSDADNLYQLATMLRTVGEYREAENYFSQYLEQKPDDKKAEIYRQFCHDIVKWENLPASAKIKNAENINSIYSDFAPVFSMGDIWFTSDRHIDYMNDNKYQWTRFGYLDVYGAKSNVTGEYWYGFGIPNVKKKGFNTYYHDGPITFSKNGKKIFITRTNKKWIKRDSANYQTHCLQLFYGELNSRDRIRWKAFPYNNSEYSTGHATLSPDGNSVIFSSDKPNGRGGSDLYLSQWNKEEKTWDEPVSLGDNINTFGNEVFPFWLDSNTLYFASDGHLGYGGLDLFVVKKENNKWGKVQNLKRPINSSYDDFSITLDAATKTGAFASNRPKGKGSDDIYLFKMLKQQPRQNTVVAAVVPAAPQLIADGYVKDYTNKAPLNNATVFVLDTETQMVKILKTDKNGYFSTPVKHNKMYMAKAMKNNYFYDLTPFRTDVPETVKKIAVPRDLLLQKYALNQEFKIEDIYYDLDRAEIRKDAEPPLDRLVKLLKTYPIDVELGSHTDSRASKEYNMNLSQRRAESAVRYLVLQGIAPYRISAKGYGESQLVNKCADDVECREEEHQANRRTTFKIVRINTNANGYGIDLSQFKDGDIVPLRLLPQDFFSNSFIPKQ